MEALYRMSVYELLAHAASTAPEKIAIVDGKRRISFRELREEVNALAVELSVLGIEKGDRVAVNLPNWYETIAIYFAIGKIGAILVPINNQLPIREVEYFLENSEAKALFFSINLAGNDGIKLHEGFTEQFSSLKHLIPVRFQAKRTDGYEAMIERGRSRFNVENTLIIKPEKDTYAIMYTSGTTGKPKGAMLTHKNVIHTAVVAGEWMKCRDGDVFLLPLPLFHITGVNYLFRAIAHKGKLVLMETFRPERALSLIEEEKVTVHPGVPAMFLLEINYPYFSGYDTSSLRTGEIAGVPCPLEIVHRVRTEMDCNILMAYGLTETSSILTVTGFDGDETVMLETVGKPLPGVEVKIVDETRQELKVGETGELACRSFGLMKGYYGMPEKTREATNEEGWFYTGDIAVMDENGYIRIVGRREDVIIRDGHYIYPRKVEELFISHPGVFEVAVVSIPDPYHGEIFCACLRLRTGVSHSEEDMKNYIRTKATDCEVPDRIIFLDNFPITASGKIRKNDLQNQVKNVII